MACVAGTYHWAYAHPTSGLCEDQLLKVDCLRPTNLLEPSRRVCLWDVYSMTCRYHEVGLALYRTLLATVGA
jgi:hypothetical protein